MTLWQRIAREPNALTGVVLAVYGLLVAFDVLNLTTEQHGAMATLGGALVIALRWLVTPSAEVVARQPADEPVPVAGPALDGVENGQPVHVHRILGKA